MPATVQITDYQKQVEQGDLLFTLNLIKDEFVEKKTSTILDKYIQKIEQDLKRP